MATTTLNQSMAYSGRESRTSVFTKFINWCESQNNHRFLWLGVALAGHGCILTPLTALAVVLFGNVFFLFVLAIIAMAINLVPNLAALPTKYTIPVFFISIVLDVAIVAAALAIYLSGTNF